MQQSEASASVLFFVKRGSGVWRYRKWAVKLCGKGGGREPGRCAGSGCGRREAVRVRKSPLTVERKNKKTARYWGAVLLFYSVYEEERTIVPVKSS